MKIDKIVILKIGKTLNFENWEKLIKHNEIQKLIFFSPKNSNFEKKIFLKNSTFLMTSDGRNPSVEKSCHICVTIKLKSLRY